MPQNKRWKNILSDLPDSAAEIFETLLEKPGIRIERIISSGQSTPAGEWYDQEHDEWVLLLTGAAKLLIEGEETPHRLEAGDCLMIPAGCRHRVEWTDPDQKSVWLAVHLPTLPPLVTPAQSSVAHDKE